MPIKATGKITLTEFTVEGMYDFPYDMLRYDRCWPKTEANDSPKLNSFPYKGARNRRQVTLVSINGLPTIGRWESFGWRVVKLGGK